MDLLEYQGKQLFRKHGLNVSDGKAVTFTPVEPKAPSDCTLLSVSEIALVQRFRSEAETAKELNHAPYSNFTVLAAIKTPSGIFAGTNMEVANYSLTKHAEEVAIINAFTSAGRVETIEAVYVTTNAPCGSCRQFIAEFADSDVQIFVDNIGQGLQRSTSLQELPLDSVRVWTLDELLPAMFGEHNLRDQA